ncbi:WhiB family transcriptional regulator [Streptomyces pseudovenezuelae]|uniref:Transcriptional regulator WhiB n=1 Tax=Streptomyces pseudovenezuelae TaxID=67350 RepID=A0ABT6LXK2_9ACTN|nr:WhiB family transcriptional regulator [Streptomyces pseudovenezuelae]MDH6220963.1 WhiB family redox-sensing transcriptional regulator [Streptomyces pseudovenezuelae]
MDLTDDWRDQAACRYEDPDLFFPIGTSGPALLQTEQAKGVCGRCPVREQCLRWALDTGECLGIWGGTSETERRTLQLRRRRAEARQGRG